MRTLVAPLILALVGLAVACGGGGSTPAERIAAERIAFVSSRGGDDEIWVMDADGSNAHRLTHMAPLRSGPVWSPDGREIAFLAAVGRNENADIYIMNADGSNVRQFTDTPEDESSLVLSPDGQRMAFTFNGAIFLMNRDGSDRHPILVVGWPSSWSPDGTQIAFTRGTFGHYTSSETWIVGVDGTDRRRLVEEMGVANSPVWSPDGSKIAFECAREALITMPDVPQDPGAIGICVVSPDGSGLVRLVDDAGQPAWSPDGQRIAFERGRRIYVMRADGSDVQRITDCDCQDSSPAWSPR